MTQQEIRKKFDEIVTFAEVEQFLDMPVKHYSSGMYVRLAFAVAAHLEPDILIVDEVLAVGDIQFQKKCLGKMEGVVKEGRTVLFVSHQISAVNQLCHSIVWLDKGTVVNSGAKEVVLPKFLAFGLSDTALVTVEEPKTATGFFFSKISVLDHRGSPSTQLDAKASFSVRLHYEVSEPLADVEMAIRIKTIDGVSVFTTTYSDYSDLSKMTKKPGFYIASVQVPALFLMPGCYTISVHAFQFKGYFHLLHGLDAILRLEICETGTKVAKYNDHKNIGVVLVDFPWEDRVARGMAKTPV
jgi:lipopolysaccharide transport system ATP-binding protein